MPKRLLLLGAGTNQAGILDTATRLGIETVALDADPEAGARSRATQFIQTDICDPVQIAKIATEYRLDGIYPASDLAGEAALRACPPLARP